MQKRKRGRPRTPKTGKPLVSFSGGKSSAMMLHILKENLRVDEFEVVFANTGREREETLQFVKDCQDHWGLNIHWVEWIPEKPNFRMVDFSTASRKGEPFEALINQLQSLPSPRKRFCTSVLKVKTIRQFVRKKLGWTGEIDSYIGLRADEPNRVAAKKEQNNSTKKPEYYHFPLFDMGITRKDVDAFWKSQPFNLTIPSHLGNCDFCFMKSKAAMRANLDYDPTGIRWWKSMEEKAQAFSASTSPDGQVFSGSTRPRSFHPRYSYEVLENFLASTPQLNLRVDESESLSCGCTD